MDRIAPNHLLRLLQLDARQLRGALIERFGCNSNARHNSAAQIITFLIYTIKRSRCTEINHDQRAATIKLYSSHRIDNPVSSYLTWILISQIESCLDTRTHDQRGFLQIRLTHLLQHMHQRRND
ncbi:hypothetical protein D3C81_1140030 [compost metagenome]